MRFGSFSNAAWMGDLLKELGEDIAQVAAPRGHVPLSSERIAAQLGMPDAAGGGAASGFAFLGDAVVSDVALIGRDTFVADGAAIGVMFRERIGLFKGQLDAMRKQPPRPAKNAARR